MDYEGFVEKFRAAWAAKDPKQLAAIFAPGAKVKQPPVRAPFAAEQVEEYFTQVFLVMPDMRLEPTSWAARHDTVFIEWTITTPAPTGESLSWSGVDRFHLRDDGFVVDEAVYFDSLPLWEALDPSMRRDDMIQLATNTISG